MHDSERRKGETLEEVVTLLRKSLAAEQLEQATRFVEQYYRRVAARDLVARRAQDLYGAALAQWGALQRRPSGRPHIKVYNPDYEEHGWESTHTIIEINHDDMPFLVDSVNMEVARLGLSLHLLIHPVLLVSRDRAGKLLELHEPDAAIEGARRESAMHLEVDRQTDRAVLKTLQQGISGALAEVRVAVADWQQMRERMHGAIEEIGQRPPPLPAADVEEDCAYLSWAREDNFTFLGYRCYELIRQGEGDVLQGVPGTGLGILRDTETGGVSRSFSGLPPELQRLARKPQLLILTKSNSRSRVHRAVNMDYIGIKRFDAAGAVIGEHRFLGLYTSGAYNVSPRRIPVLRRKVQRVVERAALPKNSHDGKALVHILESYPRDELIQVPEDELVTTSLGILGLQDRRQVRLFVRRDAFSRFVSCLVFVPRDSYNTELRVKISDVLMAAFGGVDFEFTVQIAEESLARVHLIVRTEPGKVPAYDLDEIEAKLREVARRWEDVLYEVALEHFGEERGNQLFERYGKAFPAGYREQFGPRTAVYDIEHLERVSGPREIDMSLSRPPEAPMGSLRFRVYRRGEPIFLSRTLPMLESMGVEVMFEHPHRIRPAGSPVVWIHNFGLRHAPGLEFATEEVKGIFQEAFARAWSGQAESDGFSRLVLGAQLDWRETGALRAYSKYLRQVNASFSEAYMADALARNAGVAKLLIALFRLRFDPQRRAEDASDEEDLVGRIGEAIDAVSSLDEDRILRRYLTVIQATLRTNFFQTGAEGEPKPYLSFKVDPTRVPDMPAPRPAFEIFVYSPRVEGVHLRGGAVARGGLRWSDRKEDYRTEILGLMKSQLVKNTLIVPVGAKGGFIVKRPPAAGGREDILREVKECYRSFIRGLLDLTDNLVDGEVVAPAHTVRHDGDDPYLVVAADKGTATFSDLANAVAEEYGFWLGDAFASGGSAGYDHKKLGITARGAWEAVRRHFRERGHDIDAELFTVVGIGDMAGDVFGNGMLLSRQIKLVAAFNHLHVFLDPDPDPAASFAERARLFALPHSSWADYDASKISAGGGVYSRQEKSIALSPQVRAALGIEAERMAPNELIRAMLMAPVDLLWNGGIGTFVKASTESHAEAGDRTNDAIRVDGSELRCKVAGEGGNLGFTQLGRIEFAAGGGALNTDFVDNSGGVDCSDHEVNIKILLNSVLQAGDLTRKQRDRLLASMADEVCEHVLAHNQRRSLALSILTEQAPALLDEHARYLRALERGGRLDRRLEFLPDDETIEERRKQGEGLARPELAIVLAYSAIELYEDLLQGQLADDPYFGTELTLYFPRPIRERYALEMGGHRLKREIIATMVTNSLVDRVGPTLVYRLREETGSSSAEVARCYTAAREVFSLRDYWTAVEQPDNCPGAAQATALFIEGVRLLKGAALWFLRHQVQPLAIAETIEQFAPGVSELRAALPQALVEAEREQFARRVQGYRDQGVSEELAHWAASMRILYGALDFTRVRAQTGFGVAQIAALSFDLGERLGLRWLREQIGGLAPDGYWQTMACAALADDVYAQQSALVAAVLASKPARGKSAGAVERWLGERAADCERWLNVLAELQAVGTAPDLAMLSVAVREVRDLVSFTTDTGNGPAQARPRPPASSAAPGRAEKKRGRPR